MRYPWWRWVVKVAYFPWLSDLEPWQRRRHVHLLWPSNGDPDSALRWISVTVLDSCLAWHLADCHWSLCIACSQTRFGKLGVRRETRGWSWLECLKSKYFASHHQIVFLPVARRGLAWKDGAAPWVNGMISSPVPSRNCLELDGSAAAKWRPPALRFASYF